MPKDTPSMAKNKIRRSLLAILDPHPSASEINELWAYFEARCVYCGVGIARESRTGHLDHVIASTHGGSNGVHNCVLSCSHCNGDEKREEDWLSFLRRKAASEDEAARREVRIREWLSLAPVGLRSDDVTKQAERIIGVALTSYEEAVKQMRALR